MQQNQANGPGGQADSTAGLYRELTAQAEAYLDRDLFDQAELCYRQAAVVCPNQPAPFIAIGVLQMQRGQLDRAVSAFRTAVDIAPTSSEAWAGLAMAHHELGDFGRAFETYLKSLEYDSDNLLALLGLFQTSCQMGTFATIIRYLEAYLETHPHDHAVQFCLATLYAREDMLIQAKQALLAVLDAEPDKPEARDLLDEVDTRLSYRLQPEVA